MSRLLDASDVSRRCHPPSCRFSRTVLTAEDALVRSWPVIAATAEPAVGDGSGGYALFAGAVTLGGSNFLAVRLSNRELDPFWGAGLRFTLATGLFAFVMVTRKSTLPRGRVLAGSPTVMIEGKPAARTGSPPTAGPLIRSARPPTLECPVGRSLEAAFSLLSPWRICAASAESPC